MGRKPLDPKLWEMFAKYQAQGKSMREAARLAGISYPTVMRHKDLPDSPMNRKLTDIGISQKGIPDLARLNKDAQRAYHDFGYFRQRYFARASTPWAEEAAYKCLELAATPQKEFLVINIAPGVGKALALDTPIPTPSGFTHMGDLEVGDEVFDEQGKICRVTGKSEIFYEHDCYKVQADDGSYVIANGAHEWKVRLGGLGQYRHIAKKAYEGKTGPKPSPDGRHIHTTSDLAKRTGKRAQLQITKPLELPDLPLPIDPYVLGAWLGDGNSAGSRITTHPDDVQIIERIRGAGYTVTQKGYMRYSITGSALWKRNGLTSQLRSLNVLGNKHIPTEYLRSSSRQRLALLQGLVDTDGSVSESGLIEFCSTNLSLAKGVQELVHSLGAKASLATSTARLYGKDCGLRYRVTFYLQDAAYLERKWMRTRNGERTPSRYLTFTPVTSVPTQCIQVDSDSHLYLAGEGMMVTHNSTLFVHDIPAWLAVRNRATRQMIGSSVQKLANGYTGRLRTTFERNFVVKADTELIQRGMAKDAEATLIADFGRFKPANEGLWRREEFVLMQPAGQATEAKEASFVAFGFDGQYLGQRFDFVWWDDLVTMDSIRTDEARKKLQDDWDSVAEARLDPGGLLVLQGQRLGSNDLYRYCLDKVEFTEIDLPRDEQPKKYHHIVYKAHYEDRCLGDHGLNAQPYPQGCLLDPYRLSHKELMGIKANTLDRYDVTYQQEDIDVKGALVNRMWIEGGEDPYNHQVYRGCWDEMRSLGIANNAMKGYSTLTVDPSPSKFWAVQWWIFDAANQEHNLIDLYRKPMQAPDFLDYDVRERKYTGLAEELWQYSKSVGKPIEFLIMEDNAAQKFMKQYNFWQMWASSRNVALIRHTTGGQNKSDPEYGVQTLAPVYKSGRVRLPGNLIDGSRSKVAPFIKELTEYPHGNTTDMVMAHWFLHWNAPKLFPEDNGLEYAFEVPEYVSRVG